jgi:hypothetical protein
MKKELLEKAKRILSRYTTKNTVLFTSDGQAFFEKNACENHAKSLEDKGTISISRSDLEQVDVADDDSQKEKKAPVKAAKAPKKDAAAATDVPPAEPTATEPAEEPAATEPAAEEPPAEEPEATEPAAEVPQAEEPAATEPAATEAPATE